MDAEAPDPPTAARPATPRPAPEATAAGRGPGATRVIGLLGGVASGKSTVASLLAGARGRILDADAIAREVLASPEGLRWLRERFGLEAVGADGLPDRTRLAERVFDPERGAADRLALEGWTHPRVRARIAERLAEARAAGVARVVLDVPLLLENDREHGLARLCDVLVFVEASPDARAARARSRGWDAGEVARREALQLPLEEKRARADHVVRNNAGLEDLAREVARVLARLEAPDGSDSPPANAPEGDPS